MDATKFEPKDFNTGKRFRPNDEIPVTVSMLREIFSVHNLIRIPGDPISLPVASHLNRTKIPPSAIKFVSLGINIISRIMSEVFLSIILTI